MRNPLSRIPWFVGAPAFLAAVVIAAFVANYLGADYFKRTRLDEANPLAGVTISVPDAAATPGIASAQPSLTVQPASEGARLIAQGSFRDGEPGHRGSGTAKLGHDASGKPVLVLEDFSVTNGPDLHVILSTSPEGSGHGLDLGKLKATDGTFTYSVPDGTDLDPYKSVTIWCASFPTVFAVATLGV